MTLPDNWKRVKIKDVGEIITGNTPKTKNKEYYGDKYFFYKPGDLDNGYYVKSSKSRLSETGISVARFAPANSILVTCVGTIGKAGYLRKGGAFNQQVNAIIPFKGVNSKFVYFYCISPVFKGLLLKRASSTTLPIINKTKFLQLQIYLAPPDEQKRIVEKVEELFSRLYAGVKSLERIKIQLKTYRRSVLKKAFEGKLTEKWRENSKKPHPGNTKKKKVNEFNRKNGFRIKIPESWIWKNIDAVSESLKNGIYKPKSYYNNNGVPCLRMYNIYEGKLNRKNVKRMELDETEIEDYKLSENDILLNRLNSRELVGKSAVVTKEFEGDIFESKNIRVKLKNEIVDSKYVNFWINFHGRNYFNCNLQQTTGMASINQKQLSALPIPVPPIVEQKKIVEEIERRFFTMDKIEEIVDKSLIRAQRLNQSILKKAFEGRLVPQNPEDVSASELFKRITKEKRKAEEKEREAKKKRRKNKSN